ncbi:hypothetical protein Cri9333_2832 [Crinalium epipsammum PCC 9333]|uniref:Uncharacterized protein n=1 Tax=Crinalium epipsammum PCC 9333 TaxID=1173022 RepID=K9W0E0_9CYAN|nr:hypothetical protein Cri9333_2832 [Crinalium epipsammum PCC 9333]
MLHARRQALIDALYNLVAESGNTLETECGVLPKVKRSGYSKVIVLGAEAKEAAWNFQSLHYFLILLVTS